MFAGVFLFRSLFKCSGRPRAGSFGLSVPAASEAAATESDLAAMLAAEGKSASGHPGSSRLQPRSSILQPPSAQPHLRQPRVFRFSVRILTAVACGITMASYALAQLSWGVPAAIVQYGRNEQLRMFLAHQGVSTTVLDQFLDAVAAAALWCVGVSFLLMTGFQLLILRTFRREVMTVLRDPHDPYVEKYLRDAHIAKTPLFFMVRSPGGCQSQLLASVLGMIGVCLLVGGQYTMISAVLMVGQFYLMTLIVYVCVGFPPLSSYLWSLVSLEDLVLAVLPVLLRRFLFALVARGDDILFYRHFLALEFLYFLCTFGGRLHSHGRRRVDIVLHVRRRR